jgi:uncharacterized membrane protein
VALSLLSSCSAAAFIQQALTFTDIAPPGEVMTDTNPSSDQPVLRDRPSKLHIPDLDILRGLAALMMVTNHLAVKVLTPEQWSNGFLGNLTFIGSFAPVVFFFVTGMG